MNGSQEVPSPAKKTHAGCRFNVKDKLGNCFCRINAELGFHDQEEMTYCNERKENDPDVVEGLKGVECIPTPFIAGVGKDGKIEYFVETATDILLDNALINALPSESFLNAEFPRRSRMMYDTPENHWNSASKEIISMLKMHLRVAEDEMMRLKQQIRDMNEERKAFGRYYIELKRVKNKNG